MKNIINHIRDRALVGLLFLVPLFAILLLIQKLWKTLIVSGQNLANLLGVQPLFGNYSVTIMTALLLLTILYFVGWLVKFSVLNRMLGWIETSVLQYIPGYLSYKAQLDQKINPKAENRIPVWVTTDMGKRPGLLIAEQAEEAIVFLPNSPDSNNGQVVMVSRQQIVKLDMNAASFFKSLQKFGVDLPAANANVKG